MAVAIDADIAVILERVEESFGVQFRPGELDNESCFSDLCAAVIAHLTQTKTDKCFTSIVFWRLRRGCVESFGTARSEVRPWTPTDLILPRSGRRQAWHRLAAATGLKLPGLEYSSRVASFVLWGGIVIAIALTLPFGHHPELVAAWFVLVPLSCALLFRLFRPFASTLSAQSLTIGDLTKAAVGLNYAKLAKELGGVSREKEILEAIRNVVADLIDIGPEILRHENPRLIDLAVANDGFRGEV